jgi:hypothetical protein
MEPDSCLTTSVPVAPVRTTLDEAHHPGDLTAVETVVVQVPAMSDALARAGVRVWGRGAVLVGVARAEMIGDLPARVRVAVSEVQMLARIVAPIAQDGAGQIERASGAARC